MVLQLLRVMAGHKALDFCGFSSPCCLHALVPPIHTHTAEIIFSQKKKTRKNITYNYPLVCID